MKNILKLTRQTGDTVFINLDNTSFLTSKVEMGVELTEVGFSGVESRSIMVKESISEVEDMIFKYEN